MTHFQNQINKQLLLLLYPLTFISEAQSAPQIDDFSGITIYLNVSGKRYFDAALTEPRDGVQEEELVDPVLRNS